MLTCSRTKTITRIALAIACIPICMAGSCPAVNCPTGQHASGGTCVADATSTTLLDQTSATATATFNFSPTAAGKTINCSVTGNVTNSRPALQVFDVNGALVINKVNNGADVTSNSTTGSFTSTSSGLHVIKYTELVAPSSTYHVLVTEAP